MLKTQQKILYMDNNQNLRNTYTIFNEIMYSYCTVYSPGFSIDVGI